MLLEQDRVAVSYYVPYVEKEIRELLPLTVRAVRGAQVAMVARAETNLGLLIAKMAALNRRNENTGKPDDEGTRLLQESIPLIEKAHIAKKAKVCHETGVCVCLECFMLQLTTGPA